MISIHTFELTLETNSTLFNKLLSSAYKKAKKNKNRVGSSTKHSTGDVRIDDAFSSKGITIEYHNYEFRKMIKLCVNPSKILGGNDIKLWNPNVYNIATVLDSLNDYIEDYFDSDYTMDDFSLTRIDFTANLDVGRKNVLPYINLMHKIGKIKGFSHKYEKTDYDTGRINKEHSFDLKGNTNNIEFTVYDKENDLKKKNKIKKSLKAKGILRIEIRLKKRKAITKALSEFMNASALTTEEEFELLALNSKNVFGKWLVMVIPFGNYYKLKKAEEIIASADIKKKKREKMLSLLRLVPKKKSLYQAIKELKLRDIDEILELFAKLNVSPITISKREDISFLENLYNYLEL